MSESETEGDGGVPVARTACGSFSASAKGQLARPRRGPSSRRVSRRGAPRRTGMWSRPPATFRRRRAMRFERKPLSAGCPRYTCGGRPSSRTSSFCQRTITCCLPTSTSRFRPEPEERGVLQQRVSKHAEPHQIHQLDFHERGARKTANAAAVRNVPWPHEVSDRASPSGDGTNGIYLSGPRLAIRRFISAQGRVSQP